MEHGMEGVRNTDVRKYSNNPNSADNTVATSMFRAMTIGETASPVRKPSPFGPIIFGTGTCEY